MRMLVGGSTTISVHVKLFLLTGFRELLKIGTHDLRQLYDTFSGSGTLTG